MKFVVTVDGAGLSQALEAEKRSGFATARTRSWIPRAGTTSPRATIRRGSGIPMCPRIPIASGNASWSFPASASMPGRFPPKHFITSRSWRARTCGRWTGQAGFSSSCATSRKVGGGDELPRAVLRHIVATARGEHAAEFLTLNDLAKAIDAGEVPVREAPVAQ